MKRLTAFSLTVLLLASTGRTMVEASGDGFNDVVRAIEQFYHVKHQSLPLLARAGMKAVTTAARIRGGDYKRIAEAGSVRIAFFEDQTFDSRGRIASFKATVQRTLEQQWSPLVQTLAAKEEEQTYVFIREAGSKFHVLVVTIDRREATVVQVTISPQALAELMKDPNEMGKTITQDATINDN
jgi:hypothetical protein